MAQSDGYSIDGSKDAKEYYWTGAKGERRAYGKAYADAKSTGWNDNKDYMTNVGKGAIKYDQARMKDTADWEDVKQSFKKRVAGTAKTGTKTSTARKKTTRKRVAGK